jgi:hypothetical protein
VRSMTDCSLPPNQKWILPNLNADGLEEILSRLRRDGEIHIFVTEGALIPSLVSMMSELFNRRGKE